MQQHGAIADFLQHPGNQFMPYTLMLPFGRNDEYAERCMIAPVSKAHRRPDHTGIVFRDNAGAKFVDELLVLQPVRSQYRTRQLVRCRHIGYRHPTVSDAVARLCIIHALFPVWIRCGRVTRI
jgi:uracil-DNA glycosylase